MTDERALEAARQAVALAYEKRGMKATAGQVREGKFTDPVAFEDALSAINQFIAMGGDCDVIRQRNLYKGKYRALLKLVKRMRVRLVQITDHIEDESDRCYLGSSNDADLLRDLCHEADAWVWDAIDKTNQLKADPYAQIREQRARAEIAEAEAATRRKQLDELLGRNLSLSPWTGWDDSRGTWSRSKHQDEVCQAVLRGGWAMEDAAIIVTFIDQAFGGGPHGDPEVLP